MKRLMRFFAVGVFFIPGAYAQEQELVNIDVVYENDLIFQGFELARDEELQIDALGLFYSGRRYDVVVGNAWILDAETRDVVWSLRDAEFEERRELRVFSGTVALPQGQYEVYYSAIPTSEWGDDPDWEEEDIADHGRASRTDNRSRRGWLSKLLHGDWDHDYDDRLFQEFGISVKGNGTPLKQSDIRAAQQTFRNDAVLSLPVARSERYEEQGFALEREMELEIYALGEALREGEYDYGWIMNANTLEIVWSLPIAIQSMRVARKRIACIERAFYSLPVSTWHSIHPTVLTHHESGMRRRHSTRLFGD